MIDLSNFTLITKNDKLDHITLPQSSIACLECLVLSHNFWSAYAFILIFCSASLSAMLFRLSGEHRWRTGGEMSVVSSRVGCLPIQS